jgi:hypothetical protein
MQVDRRHYPRLNANVFWRSPGLRGPRRPVKDVSLGGMRMYSDESIPVGTRLKLELLMPGEATLELLAQVVWVEFLPSGQPARCDVAVEFLDVPEQAKDRLLTALNEAGAP